MATVALAVGARSAVEEGAQALAHAVGQVLEVGLEEADGVALHAFAEGGLGLEDGAEDRAVGPVVEEGEGGVDGPEPGRQGGGVWGGGSGEVVAVVGVHGGTVIGQWRGPGSMLSVVRSP
jgi:hypothetical protein